MVTLSMPLVSGQDGYEHALISLLLNLNGLISLELLQKKIILIQIENWVFGLVEDSINLIQLVKVVDIVQIQLLIITI